MMLETPEQTEVQTAKDPLSFSVKFADEKNKDTKIIWNSSDKDVARVDDAGNVYFTGFGSSMITASTIWHTRYSADVSESNPAVITVQTNEKISDYERVAFLQRTGPNGLIQKYQYIIGTGFNPATHTITGETKRSQEITIAGKEGEVVDLPVEAGTEGTYLQIRVLKGNNNYAAMADILIDTVISNNTQEEQGYINANRNRFTEAAKTELEDVIASAKEIKNQNYTDIIWQNFQQALAAAEEAKIAAYNAAEAGKNSSVPAELIRFTTALANAQKSLTEVKLANGNTATVKDVLYKVTDAAKKTVTAVNGTNKNGSTSITIQSTVVVNNVTCTVTEINANAFKGFKKLKKVIIGSNVAKVGNAAFSGCKNLKTIKIQSKTLKTFSKKALKGTSPKLTVKVPKKMNPAKLRNKLVKQIKKAGNKKVKVK